MSSKRLPRKTSARSRKRKVIEDVPPEEMSGTGTFIHSETLQYVGEWKLNRVEDQLIRVKEGTGTYTDGTNVYTGHFKDDAFHGHGHMQFSNGDTYEGDFYKGEFQGTGTFLWRDGSKYMGLWRHNKMHGMGVLIRADGSRYHGEFYNGLGECLARQIED